MAADSGKKSKETIDLSRVRNIKFSDVENYAIGLTGCNTSTQKAYKYFAEPGYLHNIKVLNDVSGSRVTGKCHRSMKKNETPHGVVAFVTKDNISGHCSCVAGKGGSCQHLLGLLLLLAHYKQLGLQSIPDDITSTMMSQRWSVPRGRVIEPQKIDSVMVKKPRDSANYNKCIRSTLYSPASQYLILNHDNITSLNSLDPKPAILSLLPDTKNTSLPMVQTKFANLPKGCVISYQQILSSNYLINDYANTEFPALPINSASPRFLNNVTFCLKENQLAKFDSLSITQEMATDIEEKTRDQDKSILWHSLRSKRITASKFGCVAKRRGDFDSLVKQLNPSRPYRTAEMKYGLEMEDTAASVYALKVKSNKVNLYPSGLVINPECPWLGCSPDRKVFDMEEAELGQMSPYGLLEIKVVCKQGVQILEDVIYLKKISILLN